MKVDFECWNVMTVWPDPRSELQSQTLREITARLLCETDPEKLRALVAQLTHIVEAHISKRLLD
jgi:hypothetical protein